MDADEAVVAFCEALMGVLTATNTDPLWIVYEVNAGRMSRIGVLESVRYAVHGLGVEYTTPDGVVVDVDAVESVPRLIFLTNWRCGVFFDWWDIRTFADSAGGSAHGDRREIEAALWRAVKRREITMVDGKCFSLPGEDRPSPDLEKPSPRRE